MENKKLLCFIEKKRHAVLYSPVWHNPCSFPGYRIRSIGRKGSEEKDGKEVIRLDYHHIDHPFLFHPGL